MSIPLLARPRRALTVLVSGALLMGSATVLPALFTPADATVAGTSPNGAFASTSTLDFKSKCPGTTTTATLAVGVDRENASGQNKTDPLFADGATLTITQTQAPSSPFSVDRTSATVTLPSNWSTNGNTTITANFLFTYVAPTAAPADQVVTYDVTGAAAGGGTKTLTTSATLKGDVKAPNQCTVADTTPPVITPVLVGTSGTSGWFVSDVTLTWQVSDPESGVTSSAGCDSYTQSTDTTSAGVSRTCSATNGAGLTNSVSQTIKRDVTAPTVDAATLQAGSDTPILGVFNGPFTVSWSGSDSASGIASCESKSYSGPDTTSGALTGGCTDNAGNSAAGTDYTFGYDATGPAITPSLSRSGSSLSGPDSNGWFNKPFSLDWSADETGVTCPAATAIGGADDETAGHTVSVTCTDAAGNEGKGTFTYKYDETAPTVTVASSSDANAKGWRNAPFTLTATGEDNLSDGVTCDPVASIGGADDETANGTKALSCTDAAGNSATKSFSYKYDETAPTASIALDREPVHGWYKDEVTATTTYVTPAGGSETSPVTCSAAQPYSAPDGENVSLSGSCADEAGNASGPATVTFNYDATAPTFVLKSRTSRTGTDGTHDWNKDNVTVVWTCTDATSGFDRTVQPASMTADITDVVSTEGSGQTAGGTCTDIAGNSKSLSESDINIDKTAPTIGHSVDPATPNANNWYRTDVTVTFACDDTLSGVASCLAGAGPEASATIGEGASQSVSGTAMDHAGNTADDSATGINVDETAPIVSLVGGPSQGGSYYFGSVPAAPTCSASDALSTVDGECAVGGYSTAVGPHTVTATAQDKAGNPGSASASYTVLAWTLSGFYAPVDMSTPSTTVFNTVKAGSTVPLKFELFAGSTELTDPTVISFSARKVSCSTAASEDAIEAVSTGGTSLRYDSTAGQFVQNWKTPTGGGICYAATVTSADGSAISAYFKTK